jgi:hypothetical protein
MGSGNKSGVLTLRHIPSYWDQILSLLSLWIVSNLWAVLAFYIALTLAAVIVISLSASALMEGHI